MKRLRLNRWLISSVALAMLILVFWPQPDSIPSLVKTTLPDSDFYMQGIIIRKFNSSGLPTNTLVADKMEHSSKLDVSILDNPTITFAGQKSGNWQLHSKNGVLLKNSRIIRLDNGVRVIEYLTDHSIRTQVKTDSLTINLENNVASTEEKVTIDGQTYHTEGTGLEVNFDQLSFYLKKNITTQIY